MKKLKNILESKYTSIIVFFIMIIFVSINKYESKYDKDTNKIIGIKKKITNWYLRSIEKREDSKMSI